MELQHDCNAYCHGEEHCSLYFTDLEETQDEALRRAQAIARIQWPYCTVVRIAPAREASTDLLTRDVPNFTEKADGTFAPTTVRPKPDSAYRHIWCLWFTVTIPQSA